MNILLVITGLAMGGAENQVVSLADELADRGHKVALGYILQPAVVLPCNEKVQIVWLGGIKSNSGMVKAYINLAKLINQFKPDVVHSHMIHANLLSRLVRLISKVPRLICTAHSNHEGGKARMLAYKLTDKLADEFTNVSHGAVEASERTKSVPVGRMRVIHNGIDTQRFRFEPTARQQLRSELGIENSEVFIAIGRFHKSKDYPNLLDAFAILSSNNRDTHLLIVGEGDLRQEVERKIDELSLRARVTLLGIRTDVPHLLSAADIFVLSSEWEGFGLVVAEAMACQRVVIATDCGGVAEVLGEHGFLVVPKDSAALAENMLKALKLPEDIRKQCGALARQHIVQRFSLGPVVDRWLEIYK